MGRDVDDWRRCNFILLSLYPPTLTMYLLYVVGAASPEAIRDFLGAEKERKRRESGAQRGGLIYPMHDVCVCVYSQWHYITRSTVHTAWTKCFFHQRS